MRLEDAHEEALSSGLQLADAAKVTLGRDITLSFTARRRPMWTPCAGRAACPCSSRRATLIGKTFCRLLDGVIVSGGTDINPAHYGGDLPESRMSCQLTPSATAAS